MTAALSGLSDFDEVARPTNAAMKNLTSVKDVGARVNSRIHEALTAGLTALNS